MAGETEHQIHQWVPYSLFDFEDAPFVTLSAFGLLKRATVQRWLWKIYVTRKNPRSRVRRTLSRWIGALSMAKPTQDIPWRLSSARYAERHAAPILRSLRDPSALRPSLVEEPLG